MITAQLSVLANQLVISAEELRVVRHIEVTRKTDFPGILASVVVYKNLCAPIDLRRQCRIATGPENRASLGVGVQESKVAGLECVDTVGIQKMVESREVEAATDCPWRSLRFPSSQKAELEHSMNIEKSFPVLKII